MLKRAVFVYLCIDLLQVFLGHMAYAQKEIESIEIIASTPTLGMRVNKNTIPSNIQTARGDQIEDTGALNLADFLQNNFTSVHINDNQGNPFQLDLNFRGYSASPLLGTPQGISVYVDGVRMNQPFGDVVSWDLIIFHVI
jgi:hypothetical protein